MKIGFIGFGRMGSALVAGALKSGTLKKNQITAYDHSARGRENARKLGIHKAASIEDVIKKSELIWLCVKPQGMADVLNEVRGGLLSLRMKNKGFVSIAAGVPLSRLEKGLGNKSALFRVMPNTPALLLSGMSAVTPGDRTTARQRKWVTKLLQSVGDVVSVPETWMDSVTAVSGSGPAYVFYLAEALMDGAVKLGIQRRVARRLVHQTVYGAGRMLAQRLESAEELRRQVTSPGGTTAAAIAEFERGKFKKIIEAGLLKAVQRSRELSK